MQLSPLGSWLIELAIDDLVLVLFASASFALVSICFYRSLPMVNARKETNWIGPQNTKVMVVQKTTVALNAERLRPIFPSLAMVFSGLLKV